MGAFLLREQALNILASSDSFLFRPRHQPVPPFRPPYSCLCRFVDGSVGNVTQELFYSVE